MLFSLDTNDMQSKIWSEYEKYYRNSGIEGERL